MSSEIRVLDARFVTTAVTPEQCPEMGVTEIAFVGRSNVGKSSMINALTGRRKLVRVSKTPGRTRTLNFFMAELRRDEQTRRFGLVDLPGYGFARVAKVEHERWDGMIVDYLKSRRRLRLIVQIVDAEVGATAQDQQTLDYLKSLGREVTVVATKADRISKSKRKPQLLAITEAMRLPRGSVLAFSSHDGAGVSEVLESIWEML